MDNNIKSGISIEDVDFQEAAKIFRLAGMSVQELAKSLDGFRMGGITTKQGLIIGENPKP